MIKNVLVTGGNGMVGRAIVSKLSYNYNVRVLCRTSRADNQCNNISYVTGDICNTDGIRRHFENIDCVIHLAALVRVNKNLKDKYRRFMETNVEATSNVLRLCSVHGVQRVLFFSTNDVYKESTSSLSENSEIEPRSLYALSKYRAERECLKAWKETHLPVSIIRPASIFGENDNGSMKTLIKLCKLGYVPVINGGANVKALSYLDDIVEFVNEYLQGPADCGGQIFNHASGNYTISEIIDAISEVHSLRVNRVNLPKWFASRAFSGLPLFSKLANLGTNRMVTDTKIDEVFGYVRRTGLKEALGNSKGYYEYTIGHKMK